MVGFLQIFNSYPSLLDSFKELPNVLYAGFDPTAESLHVGNLVVVTSLLRAAMNQCHSIAIVGGATALIGDPSGKETGMFYTICHIKMIISTLVLRSSRIGTRCG